MTALNVRVRDATTQLRATRDAPIARDVALLIARIALAWIFIYHGANTLFNAFGNGGIHQQALFFSSVAHLHPATFFAVFGAIIEFFGGLAVGLGIFGRLAAALLFGDMFIAMITVTFKNGIVSNAAGSGYEINVALAGLALVVAILGTGKFSLDVLLREMWDRRTQVDQQ
jgi:putative oxidoreductase